jgi:hypothetical protein
VVLQVSKDNHLSPPPDVYPEEFNKLEDDKMAIPRLEFQRDLMQKYGNQYLCESPFHLSFHLLFMLRLASWLISLARILHCTGVPSSGPRDEVDEAHHRGRQEARAQHRPHRWCWSVLSLQTPSYCTDSPWCQASNLSTKRLAFKPSGIPS